MQPRSLQLTHVHPGAVKLPGLELAVGGFCGGKLYTKKYDGPRDPHKGRAQTPFSVNDLVARFDPDGRGGVIGEIYKYIYI